MSFLTGELIIGVITLAQLALLPIVPYNFNIVFIVFTLIFISYGYDRGDV